MNDAAVQDNRLRKFAGFFKGYMGVMPLVTAAFAPILTLMKAIPVFESQKTTLATYSGLLGFLLLAWVFYMRGPLARAMVQRPATFTPGAPTPGEKTRRLLANLFPLFLIVGSVLCYIEYSQAVDEAVNKADATKSYADLVTRHDILQNWGQRQSIFQSSILQGLYLGIFLFAEMAFVVMALREYAYGVLKVPEAQILGGYLVEEVSEVKKMNPPKKAKTE